MINFIGGLITIGGAIIGANRKRKQAKKTNAYNKKTYNMYGDYANLKKSDLNRQKTRIGLDNSLLNYQSDYITNNKAQIRQQLDLDRATINLQYRDIGLQNKQLGLQNQRLDLQGRSISLQQSGLDMQQNNLKARMGLYDSMIDVQQSMTEAIKSQTMQLLNTEFEGMNIQKQQIEMQHQQQAAVRSIQALRDRAGLMVTTGEASVGGSSINRAVFQLANDEAMEQAEMSRGAQDLLANLSVQARSKQLQAGNTISNALRQGLMSKMNMINSKYGVISQLINNRQARLQTTLAQAGLQIDRKEIGIQRSKLNLARSNLDISRKKLNLNFKGKMADLDLEHYKLGYQQDLNKLRLGTIRDEEKKLKLDRKRAKIDHQYGQVDYNFANMFAEVAPTAYYVGKREEWW